MCRYDCHEEIIEITTFGGTEVQTIKRIVCVYPRTIDEPLRCGFYDFCEDCKERFICATERKCGKNEV